MKKTLAAVLVLASTALAADVGRGRRHELDPLWVRIEVVRLSANPAA